MKQTIVLSFIFILTLIACKNKNTTDSSIELSENETISKADITTSLYPESMTMIFDAHGGIDNWNKMKTLSFSINKPNGKEVTLTNLKTRAELIDTPTYTIGFDGDSLWLNEKNGTEYKGNARFYKGLMMYFYAMPFILGDDGIIYENADPLKFEDKTYPGILISYDAGVGVSPDDQYIIYYNSETGQMEWLGYTVTFGKDEKSDEFHFIRYNNWQAVNGLLLPKSMDWYTYEDNQPTEKRNTVEFTEVELSEEAPNDSLFDAPKAAKIITQ